MESDGYMQFFIRYYADPYEESRFEFFYQNEIYTCYMPIDREGRYQWNELLIELLDIVDKQMQEASGNKRMHVNPGRRYTVYLTEKEYKSWLDRFTWWSGVVKKRRDIETNGKARRFLEGSV